MAGELLGAASMVITDIRAIFDTLRRLKVGDFVHNQNLPSNAVAYVETLINMYAASDDDVRREISNQVGIDISFIFFTYARQIAVQSVRSKSPEILSRGLIALAIENLTLDWRDSLVALAQLYHSSRKFPQVYPDELFSQVAATASPQFRETLLAFVGRSDTDKSLGAFGLREAPPPAPFDFETQPSMRTTPTKVRRLFRKLRRLIPILR